MSTVIVHIGPDINYVGSAMNYTNIVNESDIVHIVWSNVVHVVWSDIVHVVGSDKFHVQPDIVTTPT